MLTVSVAARARQARRQRRRLRNANRQRLAIPERSRPRDPGGRCARPTTTRCAPITRLIATTSGVRIRASMTSPNNPPTITIGIVPTMISRPSRSSSPSRPVSAPGAATISRVTSARKNATTANSVPTWQAASNAIPNRPGSQPKNARARIRCPELDTGRNSVSPCTTPSSAAEIKSKRGYETLRALARTSLGLLVAKEDRDRRPR